MWLKNSLLISALALNVLVYGCSRSGNTPVNSSTGTQRTQSSEAAALPAEGFKAELTLVDPPTKLRSGEKITVQVKIKNASSVFWWARGGAVNARQDNMFYLAAGNRWLKPDGSKLTDMDGRYGIGKDLNPGEETQVPLLVTAPKEPGDYFLEVDLVQEQVAWFSDKGSPTAKTKITVVR